MFLLFRDFRDFRDKARHLSFSNVKKTTSEKLKPFNKFSRLFWISFLNEKDKTTLPNYSIFELLDFLKVYPAWIWIPNILIIPWSQFTTKMVKNRMVFMLILMLLPGSETLIVHIVLLFNVDLRRVKTDWLTDWLSPPTACCPPGGASVPVCDRPGPRHSGPTQPPHFIGFLLGLGLARAGRPRLGEFCSSGQQPTFNGVRSHNAGV